IVRYVTLVPILPKLPKLYGCAAAKIPFAGKVMIEGILTASINSFNSSLACLAPVPIIITGRFLLLINLVAFLMLRGFGAIRAGGAVSTGVFVVSFTLFVNRLFGRIKTATPFFS